MSEAAVGAIVVVCAFFGGLVLQYYLTARVIRAVKGEDDE